MTNTEATLGAVVYTPGAQVGTIVHKYTDHLGIRQVIVRMRDSGSKSQFTMAELRAQDRSAFANAYLPQARHY